jgi:hypothetical protein
MWGDMRDDPVETRYHIYYTRSKDRGQTWGFEAPELALQVGDTRVTDYPSNPNKGFPYGLFIGDYFSLAAIEGDVYLVWADTRLGEFGPINQKIGFSRQQPIPAPEVFMSPAAGPGGQNITIQGHNFQADMNVYLQMGDTTVATARTNAEGRVSAEVFVPISGEGGHRIRLVDESGNLASSSFYMEFGFDNVREILDTQQEVQRRLQSLDQKLDSLAPGAAPEVEPGVLQSLEQDLQRLRNLELEIQKLRESIEKVQEARQPEPVTEAAPAVQPVSLWPWVVAGFLGLALGAVLTLLWSSRRQRKG